MEDIAKGEAKAATKRKKVEDCTLDELRERHIMDDVSDVSEDEEKRSMEQIRSSARKNRGTRSTGDLASNDFIVEKKKKDASPENGK